MFIIIKQHLHLLLGELLPQAVHGSEQVGGGDEPEQEDYVGEDVLFPPPLPITISVKSIEDQFDLLICLHPDGHHAQELLQVDGSVTVLELNLTVSHTLCRHIFRCRQCNCM